MRKLGWLLLALAAIGVAVSVKTRRSAQSGETIMFPKPVDRRAEPDPEALDAMTSGRKIALDVEQLKLMNPEAYEPLVEYLTYIQVQRGEKQSLVFVRERDIDELAKMADETKDKFMEKFEQLGVLLSMN
jgi:hypothetical protein